MDTDERWLSYCDLPMGAPEVSLKHWRIFYADRHSPHFVGFYADMKLWHASEAIKHLYFETMIAVAESGMIYVLRGRPAGKIDAPHAKRIFEQWAGAHGVQTIDDVTAISMQEKRRGEFAGFGDLICGLGSDEATDWPHLTPFP